MNHQIKLTDNKVPDLEFDPYGIRFYFDVEGKPKTFEPKDNFGLQARVIWLDTDYGFVYHPTENQLLGVAFFDISQLGEKGFIQALSPLLFWKLIKLRYSYEEVTKAFYGPQMLSYFSVDIEKWHSIGQITYKEAFTIQHEGLRREAFEQLDVADMIESMGYIRIGVEGKRVLRKFWDEIGNEISKEIDVVYEVLEVDTSQLPGRVRENEKAVDYCVKCWCTTTEEAHYLWIEPEYKDSPLTAIASTCRVQKDLIEEIKSIKRQGDLFLFEYNDTVSSKRIDPSSEKIPLTAEQYFNLLIAEA